MSYAGDLSRTMIRGLPMSNPDQIHRADGSRVCVACGQAIAVASANGKSRSGAPLSDSIERLDGETVDEWAQRFAATAHIREARLEPRGWSPLRLFGLSIQP